MWRAAIYAFALIFGGISAASAQDICPKGRRVQMLEMTLENNRRGAQLAFQHGQLAEGRRYAAEVERINGELPYAYLDQELASFPLMRNPDCMLAVYGLIVGQPLFAEPRADGAWTLYLAQGEEVPRMVRERMTDQQLVDLVRSVNR